MNTYGDLDSRELTPGNNEAGYSQAHSGLMGEFRGWIKDILLVIVISFVMVVFLYQPVKVEGTSMQPELLDQERIFVNKFVYNFETIHRGDIVVFWYPKDPSKSFIKRVVGVPGDVVQIKEGQVYINGQWLEERFSVLARGEGRFFGIV